MSKLSAGSVFLSLILSTTTFSQSSSGTVSGTVSDVTGALIPGVSVTATNNATGIVATVISNEAGAYYFASLLPGIYRVSAELSGFQVQTYTDVQLGNAAQVRLNFTLRVATQAQTVEVTITADTLLATSSSSVGHVLPETKLRDLPLTSNNVLDLTQVMAGVYTTISPVFGANDTKFAGVSARDVNVQRDGISVSGERWPTGINSGTELHPDMVGEVRMILAPVDAEMGRGSGQVQIQTKSGTNQFHGGAVWSVKNSALDANTWENNRQVDPASGKPVAPTWRNYQQATANLGGPIIPNKTHFFVLYDQKWTRTRENFNATVLTPCAQRGIFRYYDNWNNGNALAATNATSSTPTISVVDRSGNPKAPATNPNGSPHNGILRFASVFGPLLNIPSKPDCSDAVGQGDPWDPFRRGYDATGFVQNVLFKYMPSVNNYDVGDGLNTAGSRWLRTLNGSDNLFGIGQAQRRKQINLKIDHLFTTRHKISGTWSYESDVADGSSPSWPNTWKAVTWKKPQVLAVNFTSTLSPTIVNEARFGMARSGVNVISALWYEQNKDLRDLLPKANGILWVPLLGAGGTVPGTESTGVNFQFQNIIGGGNFAPGVTQRDLSPRTTYADSISWTKGKHAFKTGAEFRIASSRTVWSGNWGTGGTFNNVDSIPTVLGGETQFTPVAGINSTNLPGLAGTNTTGNQTAMQNLLVFLSGSVGRVGQFRFINRPDQAQQAWSDPIKEPFKIRDIHQNEWAAFFKDDWKLSSRLTLNLGLRWDYYGPPWEKNGLTATLRDNGAGLFGISGRSFSDWMRPGRRAPESELIFVGPNTPNPGLSVYPRDLNNFGPAVGFALNLDDRTTIRGGYQIQYIGGSDLTTVEGIIGNPPGSVFYASYVGDTNNRYLDLTKITSNSFPVQPPTRPVEQLLVTDRTQNITAYDPHFVSPYIQNLTLSITRNLSRNVTFDVRYIGTLTRKNLNTVDLNVPNFLTNGLKEAFDAARTGGESALLDRMFNGINIAGGVGSGPVGTTTANGVRQTGAMHLRAATQQNLRNNLANGNYMALASSLNTLNYNTAFPGNQGLPFVPSTVQGAVLRYNGFPENFIKTNPQFNTASLRSNGAHSNYHSLQVQTTLRPAHGLSLEGSYTWSKDLGVGTNAGFPVPFTDPRNQSADYTLLNTNRAHVFNSYGTFNFPIGPGQLIARNSSRWIARAVENWQASWIVNLSSGAPATLTAANMLYGSTLTAANSGRGTPDQVQPFDFNALKGVRWGFFPSATGQLNGSYFDPAAFKNVPDPQCATVAPNIRSLCTLQAVADAKTGQVILQNPRPGTRGNVGLNTLEFAGTWRADMALAKSIRIRENLRATIRMDARNVFNHPTPGVLGVGFGASPNIGGSNLNINSTDPFGYIPTKGASIPNSPDYQDARQFELKLRLDF